MASSGTKAVGVQRKYCYFAGRVQGVGFRYTVKNIAMQFNVQGYVKNLADGRVELVMEGPEEEMEQILVEIKGRMEGFVQRVDVDNAPATGEFGEFTIKH
jgi:acylphosphatase